MKSLRSSLVVAGAALAALTPFAAVRADTIGEPTGFTVTVKHGSLVIASQSVTVGPGGDLQDIKISDGDSEDFVQIGTLGSGPTTSPIILKIVTEDDPTFRLLHMYIDAPVSTANIFAAGPNSLFNPANPDPIEVSITNMTFQGGTAAAPQVQNNNSFFVAFMRDQGGHFYELPNANAFNSYGHGVNDIQVPGQWFLDGAPAQNNFVATNGPVSSWTWQNLFNPGASTTIHNGFSGGLPSTGAGYVFELGLAVAFTAVPEPGTLMLLATGAIALRVFRRRSNVGVPIA